MTSQLKVMEKVMDVMEFEELNKSTNPSKANYSTLHPLFSRATSHVTTPLVQRKFYVTLRFLLLRNVSLSPVLFAVILLLL